MNPGGPTRELTVRAAVLGIVLSVVMGAANVYLGLFAGMTVSASIPAAVIGMVLLRRVLRNGTVLEANLVQTAASSGEALAAGIIFTVPALLLVGAWSHFDPITTALVGFAGGLLGVLFMVPMRRVFVLSRELPYPEGVACALVLESGAHGADTPEHRRDGRLIFMGAAVGALWKVLQSFVGVFRASLEGAVALKGRVLFFGADMSPALVGVGAIVGLDVALLVFAGGSLSWLITLPLLPEVSALLEAIGSGLGEYTWPEGHAVDQAYALWSSRVRYVGVGAMVVGGVTSIVRVRHGLRAAFRELAKGFGAGGAREQTGSEADGPRDLSSGALLAWAAVAVVLIAYTFHAWTRSWGLTAVTTLAMLLLAFFFVAVASYIVGLIGNSNSPVSGMTITAVLAAGALLLVLGFTGQAGLVATLGVATVVCAAASTAGDMCNDLKTGSLVGASPRRQQIMQIAGIAAAALVMAPVLEMLHRAYGIGSRTLPAPQAALFASLAKGLFGHGHLPWGFIGLGAVLGTLLHAADLALTRAGSRVRLHVMPIAVGMYLPFGLSPPMIAGGLIAHLHGRGAPSPEAREGRLRPAVLLASGIVAGESLLGVGLAIPAALDVPSLGLTTGFDGPLTALAGAAFLAFVYRTTTPAAPRPAA